MNWELWGIIAGLITTSGFIPQIIKGYQTKTLEDLSYLLNTFIGIGMTMWIVYGLHIGSLSIISMNILGVILNITLLLMKYNYSKTKPKNS